MTDASLLNRISRLIETQGPLSIADYMTHCLADPKHGYYRHAEPFGAQGDFVTAPEVSQLFGEIIGAWLVHAWDQLGRPSPVHLVEAGPGRGTLTADMLRVIALRPDLQNALTLHLIETSPRLRDIQAQTIAERAPHVSPVWHDDFKSLPMHAPLLFVANEFFDALPIRQYVQIDGHWRERGIGLSEAGQLEFQVGTGYLPPSDVPDHLREGPQGAILETQPTANAIMDDLAERLVNQGGVALAIDYGYARTATGDTLQAMSNHAYVPVLQDPGHADLTAHVNFEALARASERPGLTPRKLLTQADFLLGLGLLERAGQLGAGKSADVQDGIRNDVERLAAPNQMGTLFKVLAIAPTGLPLVPFDV